jgi:hypothetical protein
VLFYKTETNQFMHTAIWNSYLPVIRIVMKRARRGTQQLQLNAADFQRVGLRRKSGYPFAVGFRNGRLKNVIVDQPLASDFAQVLLQDAGVQELIRDDEFDFALNGRYQLEVAHRPQETDATEAASDKDASAPEA